MRKPRFPTVLLNVCEFPLQRRSLPSLLTGLGVPIAVCVPAALSPYRLRVVLLSLSPSCVTRKKPREKYAARNPGGEERAKGGTKPESLTFHAAE